MGAHLNNELEPFSQAWGGGHLSWVLLGELIPHMPCFYLYATYIAKKAPGKTPRDAGASGWKLSASRLSASALSQHGGGLRAQGTCHSLDSRKLTLRWRLVCKMYYRKSSWDQHLQGMDNSCPCSVRCPRLRACSGASSVSAVTLRVVPSPTGLPSKRGPGLGSFSRADRGIGGVRPTKSRSWVGPAAVQC